MDKPQTSIMSLLGPKGNGVRILSIDGGDGRCFSQLLMLEELTHRIEYDHGRSVRPCEFFHFITGVGAGGVIAILLGVLGMDTENAITAFAAICEKVFDLNVRDEASRSERLTLAMKAILDDLHIPHNTRMEGDIDRGAGCRVSICYSSALINGCRMFRNYKARRPSYNPTIIEAARVSWATPGLFSSIRLGLRSRQEELVSAVNGFNNPMLEAVQEAREVFGKERAVSTFLSLGSGMRGPVSIHSSDSLRSSVQQTDITEEDIERRLGPTGLYFRFSPEHTIQGETSDIESDLSSITSYTCAYLEREKTIRSMESFLDVSAHTSSYNLELRLEGEIIDMSLNLNTNGNILMLVARLLNMATHLQRVSNTVQPSTSHEDQDLLAELKNSGLPGIPPRAGCMKGTREHILRSVNDWTTDFGAPNILWLKGHPGVGKSAIATNVVEQLRASGRFGSCFFFQRQKATTMTPRAMWCTVAYDLARRYPTVQTSVVATLKAGEISPGTSSIEKLFQHLIHEPLSESADIPSEKMPVIVIDALDECGGLDGRHSEYRRNLVKTLENWGHLPGRFKLIVTSREEKDIERLFSATPHRQIEIQAGQTVDEQSSIDIRTFLTGRFQQIALDYASLPAQWPGAERVKELGDKAAGLFIWAETVVKFIENGAPSQRLDQVLKGKGTGDIGALYEQILNTSFHDPTEEDIGRFRSIVGTIILAKVGLYIPSLAQLLSTEDSMVEHICIGLYSVLDSQDILRFHHQSFVDFLIDRDRCPPKFYVDLRQANMELSLRCLTIMTKELKFNICGLENSHRSNAEIPDLKYRVQQRIPEALQYSCMHWSSHLCFNMEPASMAVISGQLDIFLKGEWLLYWLEVLSVMGKVAVAISVLREIKACSEKFEEQHLYLIDDVLRFVLAFYTPISTSTPHIYLSALPFLPKESMLWENVGKSFPNLLDACKGRMQSWPARPFEWRGHTSNVSSIAFSPDGRRLASGSSDDTVRIWDTETGAAMGEPLRGHTGYVICIAYSPDGRHVASGSRDQTIRIWDSEKGTAVGEPLMGHNDYVRSIAYSPDGLHIISGSRDYTIRIWDAKTGASVGKPLKGHTNGVSSVAYAPGGRHIVSGSDDKSIRIWDMQTGAVVGQPLRGHVQEVLSVAYSPDGQHIVSGSADKTIRIWNSETGEKMGGSMEAYDLLEVLSVAYSPDGYQIISGSSDNDIRIWDVATRVLIGVPLKGHTGSVRSVAYSPDGQHIISGSVDSTIRIWDAEEGGPAGEPLKGHTGWVWSVTYSQDGRHILSGSCDHTIRIWDSETGAAVVEPLKGHTDYVRSVAYSPDGRYIISGSDDGTIRFWDSESGVAVSEPLTGHTGSVWSIAYSPGGQRIISGSSDRTIRIWDKTTGATIGEPLKGHTDYVRSVAYSPDGRHIISGSDDGTVRTWDADVGTALGEPLEGHTGWVWCVAYSPDGQHIISGSSDHTIRIWDMTTGATVGMPLMGHTGNVRSVAYSPDGRYIVSGSDDRTIRIWNSETGVGVGDPLRGHLHDVLSVAYSPDGQRILSGSFDCTVRVWNAVSGAEHKGNIAPVSDELSAQTREPAEHRSTRRLDVSAFSGHTIPAEILDSNGWLHDEDGLLFWVPEDCRHGLICPAILAIPNTGRDRCIRLDFTHFRYGNSWTNVRGGRGGGPQQWTMN